MLRYTKELKIQVPEGYEIDKESSTFECIKFKASWYKKEKFDPKTLKAFDKILLRDECGKWHCGSFSHINKDGNYKFGCFELKYKYCIPYNDETRYLIGTTDEAPEYYRYWED